MKKKTFFMLAMLLGMAPTMWAQSTDETDEIDNKLSITTQMFLKELNGEIKVERNTQSKRPDNVPESGSRPKVYQSPRLYASPDTIDGKAYIAAYLSLNEPTDKSEVEAQGVILQEEFDNGLFTSLIPVNVIEKVAGISNVKRINVSPLKRIFTRDARQATNVDDALTLSSDAQAAGLTTAYDGTGVVLGVIDTGIDFQHIAFKDQNGNYRMKHAYVYNGSNATEYSSNNLRRATTDNKAEDHGTHTASTAGGSSVIVDGTNVTVTDDHANATYGGMAPGADLYLAGIYELNDTYLSNAVKKIVDYADANTLPVVVSNSWGSHWGPHDGTGDVANVYNTLFGDGHPNHIVLFASSNEADRPMDGEGGGFHIGGTATMNNPLGTILRCPSDDGDPGYLYSGVIANAWCRTLNNNMRCKIYVLDTNGNVMTSKEVTPSTDVVSVSGLSNYYSGTLTVYKDYIPSANKTQILIYASQLTSRSSTTTTTEYGSTYHNSKYTLAVEFYPTSGSVDMDVWAAGYYNYFTNYLTTNGHIWTNGDDDMSVSDEATIPNAISVGAYVSKRDWTDFSGESWYMPSYTVGDIAPFSSYATADASPTGLQYPWITAPGARLAAAVNHNHTTKVDAYSYYGDNYNYDLVVNNKNYPYAMMEGTSMATPAAAGIVALWLQAAKEVGKNMTVNDVKHVMKMTAINDDFTTTGSNASHFGNGKIDALAGINYILNNVILPDENDTNSEIINESLSDEFHQGLPAKVTFSNRTFYKDDKWNTLCLPFDLDDFTDTPLEGATVKTLEDASWDGHTLYLNFSESSLTSIKAGKPYIVKWAQDEDKTDPVFKNVTFSNVSPEEKAITIDGVVSFKGTYDPVTFDASDTKVLYLGSNNALYYPSSETTLNAFRAWFELEGDLVTNNFISENGANAFQLNFGGSTDIRTIQKSDIDLSSGWYMLDGRRLNSKPTAKGIYIHNGKKVVIK